MHINCQFNLTRSSPVFYTGEQISGSLTLTIGKKPIQLEAIKISLIGLSTTNWSEVATDWSTLPPIEHNDSTAMYSKPAKVSYTAKEIHIHETRQLGWALLLSPGSTQLGHFEFQLPSTLPATCQLANGEISYKLQVELERRGKHNKCYQQRLVIKKCIELSDLLPQVKSCETLELRLPRSVFVPGQSVAYQLRDTINYNAAKYSTRLCQCIAYKSHRPEVKLKRVIRVLAESGDLEGELHLPLTAPIMNDSPIIQISYFVEAFNNIESVALPLCVGTVAPPAEASLEIVQRQPLCFVNLASTALTQSELITSISQLQLPHSCSREAANASAPFSGFHKHCERIKLLKRQKKQSYMHLALLYFYKSLLP